MTELLACKPNSQHFKPACLALLLWAMDPPREGQEPAHFAGPMPIEAPLGARHCRAAHGLRAQTQAKRIQAARIFLFSQNKKATQECLALQSARSGRSMQPSPGARPSSAR